MTITASEMAKLSHDARVLKYGGAEGFKKHMQDIAKKKRGKRKPLDKKLSTPLSAN